VRRFDCPIIWADKLREVKKTSKGKAGKYADYKYYGTFAVAIADHEIDAVKRIWLDKHLSYDVSGAGPISIASLLKSRDTVKLANGKNMRIYLGTEDQSPDPRITEWCEDKYGPDTCPAYKGVSYIVFEDIPLEKFGNRIPQISVEAVHTKSDIFPVDTLAQVNGASSMTFSSDYMRLYQSIGGGHVRVIDVPTRKFVRSFDSMGGGNWLAESPTGSLYGTSSDFPATKVASIGADGGDSLVAVAGPFIGAVFYVGGLLCFAPYGGISPGVIFFDGDTWGGPVLSFIANHYFEDSNGNGWAVGEVPGQNKVGFYQMTGGAMPTEHLVDTVTSGAAYAMCNDDGNFLTWQNGKLFVVDPDTWTAGAATSAPINTSDITTVFRNIRRGAPSIWLHGGEYSTTDGSLIRTVNIFDWGTYPGGVFYDPVNHALIHQTATEMHWLFLDRVGSNGVTLQTVVDDVAAWCGLTGHDSSALTQTVEGYSVTQGSGKDMLAPLLDIHDVDPRPHDFQIQFVNRGSSPALTIATTELARDGDESRYVASITQDTDLPRKVTLTFADKDHDQQPNTVIAQRPLDSVDSVRESTIDLGTYVSTPAVAQKFADRYHRRQWMGREKFTLGLTAQRLAFEPADVAYLELDGITTKARLTKLTLTNGRLNTEWERDDPAIHALGSGSGAEMDGRDPETIYIPGPTKGFVKDIPLLSDADNDNNPLLYYTAGPYNSTQSWPGAYFMEGADYDTEWNAVDSSSGAEWGYSTDALGDADPWLWDRGNTVNVSGNLMLSSVTEADIDADPALNLALLGDELINFTTATLETDGSYTISGLKRGRRGTEWATGTHAANEEFVLASSLIDQEMGLSDVGDNLHFKAQTLARDIDGAPPIDLEPFTGATLKPYAPARIIWTTDGTDMFGEIIRRTRVGGSWVGGSTIPLSENSEAYEIDILDGTDVLRTITVTGTNLFTYTGAEIAADGGAVGVPPSYNAYQMSDAVGRGFALAA
jgi:hypothetical protein